MSVLVLLGSMGTCAMGRLFPWISAEVVVVERPWPCPVPSMPLVVLGCATGQMAGKGGLNAVMRWPPERVQRVLAKAQAMGERPFYPGGATFTGAASGLPPGYLTTLAAGAARLPVAFFLLAGLLGYLVRYGVVAWGAGALGGG